MTFLSDYIPHSSAVKDVIMGRMVEKTHMGLTRNQWSILLDKEVLEGLFWPETEDEIAGTQALVDRGLMKQRRWTRPCRDGEEREILCMMLTPEGMNMVIKMKGLKKP